MKSRSAAAAVPSDLFGAFADATRLRILNLLGAGELCVCDLCEVLDETQPKVSRHLAILREAGLVRFRAEGKWKFYRIHEDPAPLEDRLLGCVASCLSEMDVLAADRGRLDSLRGRLRCA